MSKSLQRKRSAYQLGQSDAEKGISRLWDRKDPLRRFYKAGRRQYAQVQKKRLEEAQRPSYDNYDDQDDPFVVNSHNPT